MKGVFAHRSALLQLFILILTVFVGYCIASALAMILILTLGSSPAIPLVEQPASVLLATQLISMGCIFLLPAICMAWLCSEQPERLLCIQSSRIDRRILLLAALSILLISPTISLVGYVNALIDFPEWVVAAEESARALTDRMLSQKGVLAFCANLIVFAVAAGITEEFFFRGALMGFLREQIQNHQLVIWIVAFIFSAIHLQFYGFFPRMLLGAYLGYLLYWTKDIRVPIFAHFMNNAMAVIGMSNNVLKENAFFAETVPSEDLTWLSVVAIICFIVFLFCVRMIRQFSRQDNTSCSGSAPV